MVAKENHHLTEVLCAFWFDPKANTWDSTFFGKFFERIKEFGYTEKTEQKMVEVKFEIKPEIEKAVATQKTDDRATKMLFRNNSEGFAIIMSANFISFHKLAPYDSWETLMSKQVLPGMKIYDEIGLGREIVQVQALYINKYELSKDEKISDYFSFVPSVDKFGIGKESNLNFQSQYNLEPNLTQQLKLNAKGNSSTKNTDVFLECSCFAVAKGEKDWKKLSQAAHDQNNQVFKAISK